MVFRQSSYTAAWKYSIPVYGIDYSKQVVLSLQGGQSLKLCLQKLSQKRTKMRKQESNTSRKCKRRITEDWQASTLLTPSFKASPLSSFCKQKVITLKWHAPSHSLLSIRTHSVDNHHWLPTIFWHTAFIPAIACFHFISGRNRS